MNKVVLDNIDLGILSHLQIDGRKSFTEIAEELKLSVGTVRNRYNRLVEENILHIIGWTDPVQAGYNAYARVMIEVKPTEKIKEVSEKLMNVKEVTFLAITSGQHDLEINLLCRDNSDLLEVMHEKIHKIEGVYETNTTVYFQVLKWASHNVSDSIVKNKERKEADKFVQIK